MIYLKDNYYHIYNRGIDNQLIFYEYENYLYFTNLIKKYSQKYSISVIAYCLIPNHFHLLLLQNSEISISRFIQTLNNSFVQAMNKKLNRKGTLFEGRAKARQIIDSTQLINVFRYIHTNPIKHGLVKKLGEWEFSNYKECIGNRNGDLVDENFIKINFTSKSNYKDLVENYLHITPLNKLNNDNGFEG